MINTTKTCFKCKIEKNLDCFHKHNKNKDGFSHICKPCSTQVNKEWRNKNKDKWIQSYKKYSNTQQVKEKNKEYLKEYRLKNKDKLNNYHNKWQKQKRENNPLFKLSHHIRTNINNYINRLSTVKNQSTLEIIGLDNWDIFKKHIESQWGKGMNWGNYGLGNNNSTWHIDHIIPISSATTLDEVKKLNHYTNLRPMWCSDNIRKSNKLI